MPLRSVYSNPIESAIKAFGDVSDILQKRDEAPMRREIMAQDIADRRLNAERTKRTMAFEEKQRAEQERVWGTGAELRDEIKRDFESALVKEQAVKEGKATYTDSEADALLTATGSMKHIDLGKLDEQAAAATTLKKGLAALEPQIMQSPQTQISISREQAPELFDSFEKIYGDRINTGTDEYGHSVDRHGVTKKIKSVLIDKTTDPPTMSFVLDVTAPVKEGQVFKHIGDDAPKFSVSADAQGMTEKGNIDLSKRPVVRNADGSISTVRSMSIEEDGKEILIPTISDSGKSLSREEAVAEYRKTGKHLGKFDSIEDSNRYAEQLHSDPMWEQDIRKYSAKGQTETSYNAPMTFDHGADPNAPVVRLPLPILGAHVDSVQKHLGRLQMLQAQLDPKTWLDKKEKAIRLRAENAAISAAMGKVDTTKPVDEQRKQFLIEFTKLAPESSVKETTDLAKTIIPDRQVFGSEAGKTISDRARLVATHGEDSPEVKAFDDAVEAKKGTQERGINKTIYGPNGATKEIFVKKGEEYTPPKGWSLSAPKEPKDHSDAQQRRRDTEIDKIPGLLIKDYRKGDKNVETIDGLDIPDEKKEELHDKEERMMELVRGGKSAAEAKRAVEKKEGKTDTLKPMTPDIHRKIVEKVRSKKPKTQAEAVKMAQDLAKSMGYKAK